MYYYLFYNEGKPIENRSSENEFETQPTPESVAKDMLRDFYQSFRLSQGKPSIQGEILKLLSYSYSQNIPSEIINDALEITAENVAKLKLPSSHKHVDESFIEKEFSDQFNNWRAYLEEAPNSDLGNDLKDKANKDFYVMKLVGRIAYADSNYQYESRPRPDRASDSDPHSSLIKDYIIGDQLKGSVHLLKLRDEFREALEFLKNTDDEDNQYIRIVAELASDWQNYHVGESFWDDKN